MSTPVEDSAVLVAIARLETEVTNLKDAVAKMGTVVVPAQQTGNTFPVTGGIAGILAAAYTLFMQATGKA